MSGHLHRMREFLAGNSDEDPSEALLIAILAHWTTLYDSEPKRFATFEPEIPEMRAHLAESLEAFQKRVTNQLQAFEVQRQRPDASAILPEPPGPAGALSSSDWGLNWILFHWSAPVQGGKPWAYRLERSADNRQFAPVEISVETEVTLVNQPQGTKFYYRVIPFNAAGDGPPSAIFGVMFGPDADES